MAGGQFVDASGLVGREGVALIVFGTSVRVRRGLQIVEIIDGVSCGGPVTGVVLVVVTSGVPVVFLIANRAITELSGGQAQRVALARCLVIRPSVILFDEPLSALDRGLRQRLAVDIRDLLKRTGISAVYVTHDPAEATTVADRITVVQHGQIQDLGPVPELDVSQLPESVASLLGGLGEVSGIVTAVTDESTTIELLDKIVVLPGRQGTMGDTVTVNLGR